MYGPLLEAHFSNKHGSYLSLLCSKFIDGDRVQLELLTYADFFSVGREVRKVFVLQQIGRATLRGSTVNYAPSSSSNRMPNW